MNTVFALIAIIGGAIVSVVAYKIVPLDKFVSPGEAQVWYDKYGKLVKILGPAAAIVGLVLLLF
jgi:hypothetical protein